MTLFGNKKLFLIVITIYLIWTNILNAIENKIILKIDKVLHL